MNRYESCIRRARQIDAAFALLWWLMRYGTVFVLGMAAGAKFFGR